MNACVVPLRKFGILATHSWLLAVILYCFHNCHWSSHVYFVHEYLASVVRLSYLATPIPSPYRNLNKEHPAPCNHLVDTLGRRHGGLDGQATNVLPSLLQQRHEVVDGQHDVGDQLVLGHADVSNGDTHAEHLLQLELDGRLDFVDLVAQVLVVGDWGREFTGYCEVSTRASEEKVVCSHTLGKTGTQETRNLLDQGVGSDESIVLACELLDQLLVLVELLEIVGRHGINTTVLGTIDIVLVTKNAADSLVLCLPYSLAL